jgi:hypothetical protein
LPEQRKNQTLQAKSLQPPKLRNFALDAAILLFTAVQLALFFEEQLLKIISLLNGLPSLLILITLPTKMLFVLEGQGKIELGHLKKCAIRGATGFLTVVILACIAWEVLGGFLMGQW